MYVGQWYNMSWWDAKGFTSLATQALKTAQKKIDKVLDIKEEEEGFEQGSQGICTESYYASNF